MTAIKFEKDKVLLLKPIKIVNTQKEVKSQHFGGVCIRYDIDFEDKDKNTSKAEFLCRAGTCSDFEVGIPRYVRVVWVAERGDATIEPCEPPGERMAPQSKVLPEKTVETIDTRNTPAPNPFNVSVNGKAATYAMAYAKDIKMAEIAARGWNVPVTDKDIDDIVRWSGKLAIGITDNMDF